MWLLYVAAAGTSAAGGLQRPPLDAMLPRLVPRDELRAASAIDGFVGNVGADRRPALAGVLIATAGLSATYAIDAATFLVSLIALSRMRAVPPPPDAAPPSLERIREGWRYARSRQDLMGTLRRRHQRDALRHPDRALPRGRRSSTAARRCSACSTPPGRSAACC